MNQSRREFRATWFNDEAWLELGLGVVRGWGYGLGLRYIDEELRSSRFGPCVGHAERPWLVAKLGGVLVGDCALAAVLPSRDALARAEHLPRVKRTDVMGYHASGVAHDARSPAPRDAPPLGI